MRRLLTKLKQWLAIDDMAFDAIEPPSFQHSFQELHNFIRFHISFS